MGSIVDLSKEQDLPGCVSAPLFLSELMRCLSEDVKKPAADMLQIFAEMAQYAAKKDDPRLNVLCLRLGLFKMPPDKLKEALEAEMERIRHPRDKDQVDTKQLVARVEKLREAVKVCLYAFQKTDWTTLGTSRRVVDLIQRCKSALAETESDSKEETK